MVWFCFVLCFPKTWEIHVAWLLLCVRKQRHTGDLPEVIQPWSCILKNDNLLLDFFFFSLSQLLRVRYIYLCGNDGFRLERPVSDYFASHTLHSELLTGWVTCLSVKQIEAEWKVTCSLLEKEGNYHLIRALLLLVCLSDTRQVPDVLGASSRCPTLFLTLCSPFHK